ncbi:hypothetical protein, partial [Planktothrix sp.]
MITILIKSCNPTEGTFQPLNTPTPTQYSFPVHKDFLGDVSGNCPNCGSNQLQSVAAQPPHGQKLVCSDCGRFIKWLPSPKNIAAQENLKTRLDALKDKVSGWDLGFINSLLQKLRISERDGKVFKISPRQLE